MVYFPEWNESLANEPNFNGDAFWRYGHALRSNQSADCDIYGHENEERGQVIGSHSEAVIVDEHPYRHRPDKQAKNDEWSC